MARNPNNSAFDADYFEHSCGRPYKRDEHWLGFFESIAQRIVDDLNPKSVLDAGCAMGFLVEKLREKVVDAFGIDISEYAINKVHPSAKEFCTVASISEPLDRKYDLIVCIEVLEHLSPDEAQNAINNLCTHSSQILFSSTPFDQSEPTHINIQPPEYWADLFAREGFYRIFEFDSSFVTDWAILFGAQNVSLDNLVRNYEKEIWNLNLEVMKPTGLSDRMENKGEKRPNVEILSHRKDKLSRNRQSSELSVDGATLIADDRVDIKSLEAEIEARRNFSHELRRELSSKDQLLAETQDLLSEQTQIVDQFTKDIAELSARLSELEEDVLDKTDQLEDLREEQKNQQEAWNKEKASLIADTINAEESIETLGAENRGWQARWQDLEMGIGWNALHRIRLLRLRLAPRHSTRDRWFKSLLRFLLSPKERSLQTPSRATLDRAGNEFSNSKKVKSRDSSIMEPSNQLIIFNEIQPPKEISTHQSSVEIIITVHNALDAVKACLNSILAHTSHPYQLILVDDGSETKTKAYLEKFGAKHNLTLIRNDEAQGYTKAANQGLKSSTSDFVILLNSDTVVTAKWLDRLIACANSNPQIGIVGPLSNTASWQSIPKIESNGDWAVNPLPSGISLEEMAKLVGDYSGKIYPQMPFLNGFCLLIRREVIEQVGYFDEASFPEGYGEEDDYALRVREEGWTLALADDAYVYHAQSQSYSSERRKKLYETAGKNLEKKHGKQLVEAGVQYSLHDRVLEGIRARSRVLSSRLDLINHGRSLYDGRSVLFILPISGPGGGGNVVILESMAMQKMGIRVAIFNLASYEKEFPQAYPELSIPVHFGDISNLPDVAKEYDSIVATFNPSVAWLNSIARQGNRPSLGYYIQGFEPYMYAQDSPEHRIAWESYTAVEELKRFTKTQWTRSQVLEKTGAESAVAGVSVDIDLFRPRPSTRKVWPDGPMRVAAMVRPASPYREPEMTIELLQEATKTFGSDIEVILFGSSPDDQDFVESLQGFPWKLAGVQRKAGMARLLNEVDVFVDFSSHQAMGLTALEAMACASAVIVPSNGGAVTYARNGVNSLVVDTSSKIACWHALREILEDHHLRERIQHQASFDICQYFPERAAIRILQILFHKEHA